MECVCPDMHWRRKGCRSSRPQRRSDAGWEPRTNRSPPEGGNRSLSLAIPGPCQHSGARPRSLFSLFPATRAGEVVNHMRCVSSLRRGRESALRVVRALGPRRSALPPCPTAGVNACLPASRRLSGAAALAAPGRSTRPAGTTHVLQALLTKLWMSSVRQT